MATEKDARDLRDPQGLHAVILEVRAQNPTLEFHTCADIAYGRHCALFSQHYSATEETVPKYMRKMQGLAVKGNLPATRVLLDYDWPLPWDMDPEIADRARQMSSADAEVVE